ncbi:MAG TPA: FHA domain-containing protein, partial [Gemmataceae bacterium]|nr:FHA domain-containing protein [Gemmataceae bacterium]
NILLDKPILLLGRHPECDIQLNSRKVSRRHCCIAQVNKYLVVRDLGSTNGIRINDVRVLEGRLKAGDELTIGNFRYQLQWNDGEVAEAPPAVSAVKPSTKHRPAPPVPFHDDDELLESCDEPVPIGRRPPVAAPAPPPAPLPTHPARDSSPMFPDEVNLARDSGSNPSAANSKH